MCRWSTTTWTIRTTCRASILDALITRLKVRNDAQLSKALHIDPAMVCKLRSKKTGLSASLIIRMHDVSGMSVNELRALANIEPPSLPVLAPAERKAA